MVWTILIPILLYYAFLLWLIIGWIKLKPFDAISNPKRYITVIIPVRNESKNIIRLLEDLENQKYPADLFEVLVINDHSTDDTTHLIKDKRKTTNINLELIESSFHEDTLISPKKKAITTGVNQARGEIVIVTDGDSRLDKNWLSIYNSIFSKCDVRLVSGPVFIDPGNYFITKVQSIEFASLIGTGAALFSWNMPTLCNGANMAFDKRSFIEVGGYDGNENIISGDDEFLLYKIYKKYPDKVKFLKSLHAIVITPPTASIQDFIHQRKRWAGKWKNHANIRNRLLAVFIFIVHFSILMVLILSILGKISYLFLITIIFVKILMEYLLISNIFNFGKRKMGIWPFLICSLFYSIYAVTFGIIANAGQYSWKGRKYKS